MPTGKICVLRVVILFVFIELFGSVSLAENLYDAVKKGDFAAAKRMIEIGADVNTRTKYGDWTPLHAVAFSKMDNKELVELLIKKGADVNAKNEWGVTPLHEAAKEGNKVVAEILIAKGADVNAKDKGRETPLHKAAKSTYSHYGVLELFIKHEADVNAESKGGYAPLHYAASEGLPFASELLLKNGADVNVKSWRYPGWTAYDYAIRREKKYIIGTYISDLLYRYGGKRRYDLK